MSFSQASFDCRPLLVAPLVSGSWIKDKGECVASHNWIVLGLHIQVWLDIGADYIIRIRAYSISFSLLPVTTVSMMGFLLNLLFPSGYKGNSRTKSFGPDQVMCLLLEVKCRINPIPVTMRKGEEQMFVAVKAEVVTCLLLLGPRVSPVRWHTRGLPLATETFSCFKSLPFFSVIFTHIFKSCIYSMYTYIYLLSLYKESAYITVGLARQAWNPWDWWQTGREDHRQDGIQWTQVKADHLENTNQ